MKKLALFAAVAAAGFALSGCDSQAENQVEETATAIDENAEAEADLLEATEAGGPNEQAAAEEADRIRADGEETKDHLENEADSMDAAPQ